MTIPRQSLCRPRLFKLEDRLTPTAGILDPTFSGDGRATLAFPAPSDDRAYATALDSLGRVVVAGTSGDELAVARYRSDGSLDPSFGIGGKTVAFIYTPDGSGDANAYSVAIDSMDRVVVAWGTFGGLTVARLTSAGAIDTSFDSDGHATVGFGGYNEIAYAVAIDSMDRIVVAGQSYQNASYSDFGLARLTAAGVLDPSFDGDGRTTVDFGPNNVDSAHGVAVDSLNRVVVVGTSYPSGSNEHCAVARLTAVGALDSSFNGTGKMTVTFGDNDGASGVAVDSLNRVVIAGVSSIALNRDIAVARLTATGTLDSSFNGTGKTTINFGPSNEYANGVAVDSLDRVVAVGLVTLNGSYPHYFAAVRLTTAGALDASFDGDGRVTVAYGPFDVSAFGVAVDALDQVVVAGYSNNDIAVANSDFALARLTTAGALDQTFGGGGRVVTDFMTGSALGQAVAVDSHGRTIVAGFSNHSAASLAVARYTTDGTLDATFDGDGLATFNFAGGAAVTVDSLDRVIVVGGSLTGIFGVARLTVSGTLDTSFDGDGLATVSFGAYPIYATAYAVAVDSLDRVIIAGNVYNGTSYDYALARLTGAGVLDTSFNGTGKVSFDFGSNDQAYGVTVDSLNRAVVVGSGDGDFDVARLTTAGSLDASFNGTGKVTVIFESPDNSSAYAVTVDSLNRVIVAGDYYNGSNYDFALARLTRAGVLDSSFNGAGKITFDFGSFNDGADGVTVDALDRVVVAGYSDDRTNVTMAVARLTTGGAFDTSFDGDGKTTFGFGASTAVARGVAVDMAGRVMVAGSTETYGNQFALARLTGDTTTATAQVNDGSAQRSRVTSLTVHFSSQVTFSGSPEQAFAFVRTGGGAVSFTANVSIENGGTVVTLNNFTGSETEFGSLRDGRYTLTALASQISAGGQALDGDADGTPGGDFVFGDAQGLFRFFGDINGDRHVDIADFGLFSSAFNSSTGQSNYLAYLDFNGDGHIDIADLGQFAIRFFTMLP